MLLMIVDVLDCAYEDENLTSAPGLLTAPDAARVYRFFTALVKDGNAPLMGVQFQHDELLYTEEFFVALLDLALRYGPLDWIVELLNRSDITRDAEILRCLHAALAAIEYDLGLV